MILKPQRIKNKDIGKPNKKIAQLVVIEMKLWEGKDNEDEFFEDKVINELMYASTQMAKQEKLIHQEHPERYNRQQRQNKRS